MAGVGDQGGGVGEEAADGLDADDQQAEADRDQVAAVAKPDGRRVMVVTTVGVMVVAAVVLVVVRGHRKRS